MARILLADDDKELCELLIEYLTSEGFEVDAVHDGEAAVREILKQQHNLLILDIMMPKMTGLEALSKIRQQVYTPVLMLTARDDEVDRIVGLEMGADDYLAKPCNPRELVARIRAILRRAPPQHKSQNRESQKLIIDDLELQPTTRNVFCKGAPVNLTSTEFSVLEALLLQAGKKVSKRDLTQTVLGRKLARYDRSMDMHVSNLRRKLGPYPDGAPRIKTIRGVGYIYVSAAQEN